MKESVVSSPEVEESQDFDWDALAKEHEQDAKQRNWEEKKQLVFLFFLVTALICIALFLSGPLMPTI